MLWLVAASLIWAFSFGLIKTRLAGLPPDWVALARMGFAFFTCLTLSLFQQGLLKKLSAGKITGFSLPADSREAWKLRGHLIFAGVVQLGIMYAVYLRSFQSLAAYQVALFTSITPVWVWLLARLYEFRETKVWKLSLKECAIALSAVAAGAYVAWLQKGTSTAHAAGSHSIDGALTGFILVQIANFCFALGQIHYAWVMTCIRKSTLQSSGSEKKITSAITMNYVFLGAVLWLSPALLVSAQVSQEQWLVLLYLGSVATGLGFYIWNQGATQVGKLTLAVMNNLKAPLAVMVSMLVFGEKADFIGIASSLAMLAVAQWAASRLEK